MAGNPLHQIHGHDGLDHYRIRRHCTIGNSPGADVIQQKHTGLVSGKQDIFSLSILYSNTYTITVRIRCQQQIRTTSFCIFYTKLHRFPDLRIWIWAGGEVPVRLLLLFDHRDIGISHLSQRSGHRFQSGTIQRRINNGCILVNLIAAKTALALYFFNKGSQHIIRNICDNAGMKTILKFHSLHIAENIQLLNFSQDLGCSLCGHLAAVKAIDFVAIVLRRIM